MPKQTALILLFSLGFALAGFAQSSHITGIVSDTAEKRSLANGSVLLLRPADSILLKHTRTDARGQFVLRNLPAGKYLLVVTYPNYADFV
ncbi:MAG: carboxypeptidase regulatory-like domain-containing protein, partial [Bacteroidetes bacterium]|nr:carboxypeptidase regulatory-like domain-containing protein [Bacteroidota bacterium]